MVKIIELETAPNNFTLQPAHRSHQFPLLSRFKRDEPEPKKIKIESKEEAVTERLETFVVSFINEFSKRLIIYHITAKGERLTVEALKAELKTGATAALVGMGVSQSLLGSLPSIVTSVRSLSSHYYLSKEKAQKITKNLEHISQGDLCSVLADAAVEIFYSFESQFMQLTDEAGDKMAMEKLAEDAAARALNYIAENANANPDITHELITKAVVLGKSEKFFDPSIKNVRIRISGSILQDTFGKNVNTVNVYEKVGLVVNTVSEAKKFYKKNIPPDSAEYAYRRLFSWEKQANGELKVFLQSEYQQEIFPRSETIFQYNLRRHEYFLQVAAIPQASKRILDKIKNRYPIMASQRVESVITKDPVLFDLRKPVTNFVGRKKVLAELHKALLSTRNTAVIAQAMSGLSVSSASSGDKSSNAIQASVSGLGGIGKTQLALRYAETYAADYDNNVLWINAETKGDLANSIRKLAAKLTIERQDRYGDSKGVEEILEEVYAYFSTGKSLFIFDNVENYREFENFLPKSLLGNKPAILITSRYRNWGNIASVTTLDVLTEEESKELIKSALNIAVEDQSQDEKIKELTGILQGLPLALQQAMAYINIQRNVNIQFGIGDYLELYKAKGLEILNFDFASYSDDPYARTVFTTWQITLDKIRQDRSAGEKALEILNIMAYICPDDIANNFFIPLEHSEKLAFAIHLLKSYSMIGEGSQQDKSTIHRLVQKVTRINLEKNEAAFLETVKKILKLTEGFSVGKEIEFHYLHFLLHMNQHVELAEALKLRAARKRILDIITYSEFDATRLLYLLDTAYMIYSRDEYLKFIGEALFVYTRYPFLLLLTSTMNYLEERLEQEIITKQDIRKILEYKYEISDKHYRLGRLSLIKEERARQLDAVRLVYEFEEKIFPSQEMNCASFEKRKKRTIDVRCLRSGKEQETSGKQLQYQRIKQHLQKVSQVAKLVSSGLFTKDTLSALLQGDLRTVAFNFALLSSSTILGEVSNSLLTQGRLLTSADDALLLEKKLSLNGKLALSILSDEAVLSAGKRQFLGNSLKVASPFLARGTSVFFVYTLKNQIKAYRAGNKAALPGILTNGAIVSKDGMDFGIEAAENLEIIEGVSVFTGPLGDAAVALIWLGSDIEQVKNQVASIEKYVHLSAEEEIIQDVRAFFHFAPSDYIQAKALNNQRVQSAVDFLKKHKEIKRIIFPMEGGSSEVFLDKKIQLTLNETMPDDQSEVNLFCLFGKKAQLFARSNLWVPIVPYPPFMGQENEISIYLCKNALGIEYKLNRTENYTLISLDAGNHTVIGLADTPNIFLVNKGTINYQGGNVADLFLLQGNAILGRLKGGSGNHNKISLENFYQNSSGYVLLDNQGVVCGKNKSESIIGQQCGNGLQIDNIQQIDGRKNKQDIIYTTEKLEYLDSFGGENNDYQDHIYITNDTNRSPKIVLRNNVVVHAFGSNARLESVNYRIPHDEIGEAHVQLLFTDPTSHRFYFDFSLDNLNSISVKENNVTFNLLFQNKVFNLVILDPFKNLRLFHDKKIHYPACPSNAYYVFQDAEIKIINKNNIYAQLSGNKTIQEIVNDYPAIASRLNMALSVRFKHNETLLIGHPKHQILYNNAWGKSHLMGNGAENVYVISAVPTPDKFPIPEVTLYKMHEDRTDTLDLRRVLKQAKQECPQQEMSTSVSQHQQDLVITLNAHYYLVSNICLRLMTTWPIAIIRLKNSLVDNWYQNLDIILNNEQSPVNIIPQNDHWDLAHTPLVFTNDKEIIVITNTDLEKEVELIILKKIGQFSFIRNNDTDLMLSNAFNSNTTQRDLCTIIFSQFYQRAEMQEKVLSATLTLLDQEILLKNYVEKINQASSFADISEKYLDQTYRTVSPSNSSRSSRQKRHTDDQQTLTKPYIDNIADHYIDKYEDRLGKASSSHKKIQKNRKNTHHLSDSGASKFAVTEKKPTYSHSHNAQLHRPQARVKSIASHRSKQHLQNNQARAAEVSYPQTNLFKPKTNDKKLSNTYHPINHVIHKQPTNKPLIAKPHPISTRLIKQQDGTHQQPREPLSRVSAAPNVTATLFAINVLMRTATREKYRQPMSEQTAKQHAKTERKIEIAKAKTFRLPRTKFIEVNARGFGLN